MFYVDLYSFSKKINSTVKPGTPDKQCECRIKESCNMYNPTIGLNLGLTDAPNQYNYAYIPSFGRYYFIREWTYENALWYASLEVDALASWRDEIGATTCYVLRASADYNGAIHDTTYPATGYSTYEESISDNPPWQTDDIESGMFVVGVAGQSTTYYLFTKGGLDLFFQYLFSDEYASTLTDTGAGLSWFDIFPSLKAQSNPLQYITSIMWMPFYTSGSPVDTIRVGWVDVPVAADEVVGSGLVYGQSDWELRRHPQYGRGTYLNNAPYSTYSLFYPPWGLINLDADMIANSNTISALWGVDLRTGQGTLTIGCGNGYTFSHTLSWLHSQVGVHYQVSQVVNRGYGVGNTFAPIMAASTSAAFGNATGAVTAVAAEIGNFAASKIPSATTIGSNGGLDSLRGNPAMQYEWKHIVDDDIAHLGRPLCEDRQINTIPGYIKTANAYISTKATLREKETILAYMNGGFYYE